MLSGTSDQAVALAKDSGTLNTGLAAQMAYNNMIISDGETSQTTIKVRNGVIKSRNVNYSLSENHDKNQPITSSPFRPSSDRIIGVHH